MGCIIMKNFLPYPTDLETGESQVSGEVQIEYYYFFSTGRVIRHSSKLPRWWSHNLWKCSTGVWLGALGAWFRCDYGRVGLVVGLDLVGDLFQSWWLWLCPYSLHHRRDPLGVVTRLGWWSHKQGWAAETGAGRAAVLELMFFGDYSRNVATIISYTSPCGGFRM